MHERATFVLHYSTSSACLHLLPRCLRLFPVTLGAFVAGRRVTARRTATPACLLGPCLCLLPQQPSGCEWSRHGGGGGGDGGGGGSCVIHGQWGWPCGANVWQSPKKKKKKKNPEEEASGGSAKAQAGPSATPSHPQCTDMSRTDVLAAFPLQEPCLRTRNVSVFPLQGPGPKLSFWRY